VELLWGVVSMAAVLFAVAWFLGPTRNNDTSSSQYDHDRWMRDPSGWHSDPLRKQTKRYNKKRAGK